MCVGVEMGVEQSLIFLKPDGVERGLVGEVISRFERVGLAIAAIKMVWISADHAKKHYAAHTGKDFYTYVEKYVTSGPVVAAVIQGVNAVAVVRKLVGGTEPASAAPGTIRGDFAHMDYDHADNAGKHLGLRNIIHASGSVEEAKQEIDLWFEKDEVHTYKNVHDAHTIDLQE